MVLKFRRGQSATEFVVLSSFMLIVFFIFFVIIQQRVVDLSHIQDKEYLVEASHQVSSEIYLAKSTLPDYTKSFSLKTFPNQNYDVTILDNYELVTSFNNMEYVVFLKFPVYGQLHSLNDDPTNVVYKTDGVIQLPNGSVYYNKSLSAISINVNPERCYLASVLNSSCVPYISDTEELSLCNSSFGLCG